MITIFRHLGNIIERSEILPSDPIPSDTIWIDIIDQTEQEAKILQSKLGIEIPSTEKIWKNHVLNRLYTENGISYMNAAIITKNKSIYPNTSPITFILSNNYLLTIRDILPTSFNDFHKRIVKFPLKFSTAHNVLEGLMEEIIVRVAHNSEIVVDELDAISHEIFDPHNLNNHKKSPSQMMNEILNRLGLCADLNSKINESLHSINRMLIFFKDLANKETEMAKNISVLATDANTLIKQTSFLSDKITFQLDATLGMINVEQNMIIKMFSVVAVFFLPPTLVCSLYGMNFKYMPELEWSMGYPFAIILMLISALSPYMYFRRKGWL